jgi:hypothetical protein
MAGRLLHRASKNITMQEREDFMQITLTIPDKKVKSFMNVLRQISYVKVQPMDTMSEPAPGAEEFYE